MQLGWRPEYRWGASCTEVLQPASCAGTTGSSALFIAKPAPSTTAITATAITTGIHGRRRQVSGRMRSSSGSSAIGGRAADLALPNRLPDDRCGDGRGEAAGRVLA